MYHALFLSSFEIINVMQLFNRVSVYLLIEVT